MGESKPLLVEIMDAIYKRDDIPGGVCLEPVSDGSGLRQGWKGVGHDFLQVSSWEDRTPY